MTLQKRADETPASQTRWVSRRAPGAEELRLQVHCAGEGAGAPVVLLPSLGRGAADFKALAAALAAAGHRVFCPEPRGIGGSTGALAGLSLATLADDAAATIAQLCERPAVLAGHAFGNRVARMAATLHPERVSRVALLAAGGRVPPAPAAARALRAVFDATLSEAARLEAVRTAFFAPGNDPAVWRDGWHPLVAYFQGLASDAAPSEQWWDAGGKPLLVIQGAQDVLAAPENGEQLKRAQPGRVTLVTLENAGHALLPEQPAAVARALLAWLARAWRARRAPAAGFASATRKMPKRA